MWLDILAEWYSTGLKKNEENCMCPRRGGIHISGGNCTISISLGEKMVDFRIRIHIFLGQSIAIKSHIFVLSDSEPLFGEAFNIEQIFRPRS